MCVHSGSQACVLRVSEYTAQSKNRLAGKALQVNDVELVTDRGIRSRAVRRITIRFSKTDQRGQATTLLVPQLNKGSKFCPVDAMSQYLQMRPGG